MSEYGTKLNIYADAACTQWLGSFQMSGTNLIQTIAWNAKDSTGTITGGSFNTTKQAQNNAGFKEAGSVFAISLGGQEMLKVLPSSQKGYQVYDIYMAVAPKTMTVDRSNIDIHQYSYATPSDGPLFMVQSTSCKDVNSNNGCTNCSIATKFAIDGVSVTLPSLPTNNAWYIPVIVRIHVGQAPSVAPRLVIPAIDSGSSTINLNGIPLSMVELSTDNKTWTQIPIVIGQHQCLFNSGNAHYYYHLTNDNRTITTFDSSDTGSKPVYVRINQMFVFPDSIIKSLTGWSNPQSFYINR